MAPSPRRTFWICLAVATALAAGLRLYKLDHGSFWLDELYTIRSCHHMDNGHWHWSKALGYVPTYVGLRAAGVDLQAIDPQDPSGWRAAGVNEWNARLPSALLGILSVPLLALAARRLLGDRGAAMLVLLLAVAPWHVYWSQAARFYVPQFLLANLALLAYFAATRPAVSTSRLTGAVMLAVAAFASQPTAAVLAVAPAVDWLVSRLPARRGSPPAEPVRLGAAGWALLTAGALVCAGLFAIDHLGPHSTIVEAVSKDCLAAPSEVILASLYLIWPAIAVFAALCGLALMSVDRRIAVYFGAAAFLPIIIFVVLAAVAPVASRYSFVALFAWLVLAAAGIDRLWTLLSHARLDRAPTSLLEHHGLSVAIIASLLAGSMMANVIKFRSGGNFHARWREAVQRAAELRQPGEPVYSHQELIPAFYLGEPVHETPASPEHAAAIPHTAWFIVDHRLDHTARYWLLPDAELIDSFPLRTPHTISSVQVYRHTPRRPSADTPSN